MAANEISTPLTGDELLEFINSRNTKQAALGSVDDIADYIRELGIPAEVLMISLLQKISGQLTCLEEIKTELQINNLYNQKASDEIFTEDDIEK